MRRSFGRYLLWGLGLLIVACLAATFLGQRVTRVFLGFVTVDESRVLDPTSVDPQLVLPGATVLTATVQRQRQASDPIIVYEQTEIQLATMLAPDTILTQYRTTLPTVGWRYRCAPKGVDVDNAPSFPDACGRAMFNGDYDAHALYTRVPSRTWPGQLSITIAPVHDNRRIVTLTIIDVLGYESHPFK